MTRAHTNTKVHTHTQREGGREEGGEREEPSKSVKLATMYSNMSKDNIHIV